MADATFETSDDRFLGGRLLLRQPKRGHRAGHDAMLLAASVAAKAGQRVADLGAGFGAAGLAVAARCPGIDLTLVEIDPALAALAAHNAAANEIAAEVVTADVADRQALSADTFDAVLMNPPFHDAARHRASPDAGRQKAHMASDGALAMWIASAHRVLKSGGALTLIWRADGLADVLAALSARYGAIELQSVHAEADKAAIRVLVRAIKGGKGPLAIRGCAYLDSDQVKRALSGEGYLPLARR